MKYTTFRNLVVGGGLLLGLGTCWRVSSCLESETPVEEVAVQAPVASGGSTTPSAPVVAQPEPANAAVGTGSGATGSGATAPALRAVDADMLALLKRPPQAKIKDATKGKPYKINLYSDGGARFERAKVDLDRDDKWDESWTFKADGSTERQVAPNDDEAYTEVWVLGGEGWRRK